MRWWVDVDGTDYLIAVDAQYVVVMESGVLVFMDHNKATVAAFKNWNYVMDDLTSNIEVEEDS